MRLERNRDGGSLSRPQTKIIATVANRHHAKPGWRICRPRPHCIWGPRVRQLSNYFRRRYQLNRELPQDIFGLDLHEIVQRTPLAVKMLWRQATIIFVGQIRLQTNRLLKP